MPLLSVQGGIHSVSRKAVTAPALARIIEELLVPRVSRRYGYAFFSWPLAEKSKLPLGPPGDSPDHGAWDLAQNGAGSPCSLGDHSRPPHSVRAGLMHLLSQSIRFEGVWLPWRLETAQGIVDRAVDLPAQSRSAGVPGDLVQAKEQSPP
jgi:hypothetical protein